VEVAPAHAGRFVEDPARGGVEVGLDRLQDVRKAVDRRVQ
jgi:hypothetical protein